MELTLTYCKRSTQKPSVSSWSVPQLSGPHIYNNGSVEDAVRNGGIGMVVRTPTDGQ